MMMFELIAHTTTYAVMAGEGPAYPRSPPAASLQHVDGGPLLSTADSIGDAHRYRLVYPSFNVLQLPMIIYM